MRSGPGALVFLLFLAIAALVGIILLPSKGEGRDRSGNKGLAYYVLVVVFGSLFVSSLAAIGVASSLSSLITSSGRTACVIPAQLGAGGPPPPMMNGMVPGGSYGSGSGPMMNQFNGNGANSGGPFGPFGGNGNGVGGKGGFDSGAGGGGGAFGPFGGNGGGGGAFGPFGMSGRISSPGATAAIARVACGPGPVAIRAPRIFAGIPGKFLIGHRSGDAAARSAVLDGLVLLVAAGVLVFHGVWASRLFSTEEVKRAAAGRVLQGYYYTASIVTLVVLAPAVVITLFSFFQIVAPGVFAGASGRAAGVAHLITGVVATSIMAVLFAWHVVRSRDLRRLWSRRAGPAVGPIPLPAVSPAAPPSTGAPQEALEDGAASGEQE